MLEWIQLMDESALLWLQENLRGGLLDGPLTLLTTLGNAGILWIALSLVMALFPRTRRAGLLALAAMGICYVFNDMVVKTIVARPRPFVTVPELWTMVAQPGSWSFPSGHTCSSFAAAGIWCRTLERRWMKAGAVVLAALMGFSRLFVGVHYPSDVLVGMCVGLIGSQLVFLAARRWFPPKAEPVA